MHDSVVGDAGWREGTRLEWLEKGRKKEGGVERWMPVGGREMFPNGGVHRKLSKEGFNREKGIIRIYGGVLTKN